MVWSVSIPGSRDGTQAVAKVMKSGSRSLEIELDAVRNVYVCIHSYNFKKNAFFLKSMRVCFFSLPSTWCLDWRLTPTCAD